MSDDEDNTPHVIDLDEDPSEDELSEEEEGEDQIDDDTDDEDHAETRPLKILERKDTGHIIIKVTRPDKRTTSHVIQHPEMVEAIGIRISQIENGSPCFTNVDGLTNAIDMAKKEFIDRRNPLIVQREVGKFGNIIVVDEWPVREMTFPVVDRDILDLTIGEVSVILS